MTRKSDEATDKDVPSSVWLVRAGAQGEDEAVALDSGLAIIGYHEIPDLAFATDAAAVLTLIQEHLPGGRKSRDATSPLSCRRSRCACA